jgi:hypothetical protein
MITPETLTKILAVAKYPVRDVKLAISWPFSIEHLDQLTGEVFVFYYTGKEGINIATNLPSAEYGREGENGIEKVWLQVDGTVTNRRNTCRHPRVF